MYLFSSAAAFRFHPLIRNSTLCSVRRVVLDSPHASLIAATGSQKEWTPWLWSQRCLLMASLLYLHLCCLQRTRDRCHNAVNRQTRSPLPSSPFVMTNAGALCTPPLTEPISLCQSKHLLCSWHRSNSLCCLRFVYTLLLILHYLS